MKIVKITVLLFFFIGVVGCSNSEEKALQYLEDKYGEEFEVMWVNNDLVTVHPMDNTDVVFSVQEDGKGYVDTYLPAKWAHELQEKLKVDIEKELPSNSEFKLVLNRTSFDESMADMSINELIEQNKDMGVDLVVGIRTAGEPDINQYSQGLYNLYNLLKNLGLKNYLISVGFVNKSEDISEFIQTSYVNNMSWSNIDATVYGELGIDERHNADNPSKLVDPNLILKDVEDVEKHYQEFKDKRF